MKVKEQISTNPVIRPDGLSDDQWKLYQAAQQENGGMNNSTFGVLLPETRGSAGPGWNGGRLKSKATK